MNIDSERFEAYVTGLVVGIFIAFIISFAVHIEEGILFFLAAFVPSMLLYGGGLYFLSNKNGD